MGRKEGVKRIVGHIVAENTAMRRVSEEVGFKLSLDEKIGEWRAEISL